MAVFDFICMGCAKLLGSGRERKIQKENIFLYISLDMCMIHLHLYCILELTLKIIIQICGSYVYML